MINTGNVIIVFHNRTETMRLYDYLRKCDIKGVLVPTPNQISSSCGLSLKTSYSNLAKVLSAIKNLNLTKFTIYKENNMFKKIGYIKIS